MASSEKIWLWYWKQGFILGANSFEINRGQKPYKRLSATLILGLSAEITLHLKGDETIRTRAILLGPVLERRMISAQNADIVIFDFPVSSPEFLRLKPLIEAGSYRLLDPGLFEPFHDYLLLLTRGQVNSTSMFDLSKRLIDAVVAKHSSVAAHYSAVVMKVLNTIDQTPLDELSIGSLARGVNLSESRLRVVFKEAIGCSVSQYMRCSAVWKASAVWEKNRRFIDVAADAGFYDQAHLNKAFNEVFGVNPSDAFNSVAFEARRLTVTADDSQVSAPGYPGIQE